jgi:hypothetical protein
MPADDKQRAKDYYQRRIAQKTEYPRAAGAQEIPWINSGTLAKPEHAFLVTRPHTQHSIMRGDRLANENAEKLGVPARVINTHPHPLLKAYDESVYHHTQKQQSIDDAWAEYNDDEDWQAMVSGS